MPAKPHRGWFQKGEDARRHIFTREECQRGFQAAQESLERRYPGCDSHFLLCALIGSKPWYTLPVYQRLTELPDDATVIRLFATD